MVMACVFDPLLPGICLHASCHTVFRPYCSFFFVFNSFIFRIILLLRLTTLGRRMLNRLYSFLMKLASLSGKLFCFVCLRMWRKKWS